MSDAPCDCQRCRVLQRVPLQRDDPLAPLAFERWLRDIPDDDWPFWVLTGLLVLMAVLLWTPGGLLTLVLLAAAAAVGSLPFLRERLDGCRRLGAAAEPHQQPG